MIKSTLHGVNDVRRAYRKLPQSVTKITIHQIRWATIMMKRDIRNTWMPNRKTGKLQKSIAAIVWHRGTQILGQTFTNWLIAKFMELGTKAHVIRARRAPYLVFQIDGQWVRTKKVNHPGTKPYPAFQRAWVKYAKGFPRRLAGRIISYLSRQRKKNV